MILGPKQDLDTFLALHGDLPIDSGACEILRTPAGAWSQLSPGSASRRSEGLVSPP